MARMQHLGWILAGLLGGSAAAADGLAIGQPTVITKPGRYVVTRNISAPGVAIEIESSDVTLDLNGFTVETTGETPAIRAHQVPKENVTIRNGTVHGVKTCMFIDRVTRLTVEELSVSGCEIAVLLDDNDSAFVEHNRLGASGTSLFIDNCKSCRIAHNTLIGGIDAALIVNTASATEIVGNTATASNHGIQVGGTGVLVRDNVVNECGTALELLTHSSRIEGNLLTGSRTGLAFRAQSQDNVYRGNTARGNVVDFTDAGTGNTSRGDNDLPGTK
jgi:nitrous oxidase accessory protein NosD